MNISKHEIKSCPRCGNKFECKIGNITQCQCFEIKLSKNELVFIKELYEDCLCINCLRKLKILYNERKILESFNRIGKEN